MKFNCYFFLFYVTLCQVLTVSSLQHLDNLWWESSQTMDEKNSKMLQINLRHQVCELFDSNEVSCIPCFCSIYVNTGILIYKTLEIEIERQSKEYSGTGLLRKGSRTQVDDENYEKSKSKESSWWWSWRTESESGSNPHWIWK